MQTTNSNASDRVLTMDKFKEMLRAVEAMAPAPAPLRVIESWHLYNVVEDWSRVRSPGRARRRRAKHRQNIEVKHVPKPGGFRIGGTLYMHPVEAAKLRAKLKQS